MSCCADLTTTTTFESLSFTSLWNRTYTSTATNASNTNSKTTSSNDVAEKKNGVVVLPNTLTGPPFPYVVPPGQCQFNETPVAVPLLERFDISSTSTVFRFACPDTSRPLQLSTCACLLAHANIPTDGSSSKEARVVTRPYTPISTNACVGYFDLLVKNYGSAGTMSRYFHEQVVQPGNTSVSFSHIPPNVKLQIPSELEQHNYTTIVMLVGGTGITPMIQALHALLGQDRRGEEEEQQQKQPNIVILYGSRMRDDILGKELLDQWMQRYNRSQRLQVVHVLSHDNDDDYPQKHDSDKNEKWERGFITRELISKYVPPPASSPNGKVDKVLFLICGPPPMYQALSGPREQQGKLSGVLHEMGYSAEQVYKF